MSDYINELYRFIENPSNFMDKNGEDIEIFLTPNLIALNMIINTIEKSDIIEKIKKNTKENSYLLLSQVLQEELRDVPNMEQYKIDICKIKLSQLLDVLIIMKSIGLEPITFGFGIHCATDCSNPFYFF